MQAYMYNDELKIKFEFMLIDLGRVMVLGFRIFIEVSVFRTFFGLILQILK
jgi:hypothetical protein